MLDNAIHRINHYPADKTVTEINFAIHWIVIYSVDNTIQRFEQPGPEAVPKSG